MEFIQVTNDNLEKEHICCAISNYRGTCEREEYQI